MRLRRAILVYLGTIVLPLCGFVWLGVQSFDRQRQALDTLRGEKLAAEVQAREQAAAGTALKQHKGAIAEFFFRMERGVVTQPALTAPLPERLPSQFLEAQRQEDLNRPDLAMEAYRRLLTGKRPELALLGMARCLAKLGRPLEARDVWKTLAAKYPDERDPDHRPFGIVAAIAAGETEGLYEKIAGGRWELSADQAEYFLAELDPKRKAGYLHQFQFARALQDRFRPEEALREGEIYRYAFGNYRVFYHLAGVDRIEGLVVDERWVRDSLRQQVEREVGGSDTARQEAMVYGGAIALVLLVLSAGIALHLRDVSREAYTSRLRADFVSGVSHELKTPITLIRLYGDTLLERPALLPEERNEFYRIIVRESERLTRLVNQVLTFSRVERGNQQYNMEAGDLAPALARTVDEYSEYLERAGFSLRREMVESAPVVFDATAVLQAAANLMDNAVKYSGESREITVRLFAGEGNVTFEVEDHGHGIPAAEQQKIFERFYRVQNGSGKGGYGLGLFLVRHVMEEHGGRVEVDSQPGHGSRFRLVFPAVRS